MNKYITIEGFEQLTKQQMFDMSAKHILSTGVKSTKNGGCYYSGTGCGASVFIKKECLQSADERDEGSCWTSLEDGGAVPKHEHHFVASLQACHDGAGLGRKPFMDDWKERMLNLAVQFNLSTDALN